jgi:hypothetical protein
MSRWKTNLVLAAPAALGAVSLAFLVLGGSAQARERVLPSWCAEYSLNSGLTECAFFTFEQCLASVRGVGGYCIPSPYVVFGEGQRSPHRSVRRPR